MGELNVILSVCTTTRYRDDVVESGAEWLSPIQGCIDWLMAELAYPPVPLEDVPPAELLDTTDPVQKWTPAPIVLGASNPGVIESPKVILVLHESGKTPLAVEMELGVRHPRKHPTRRIERIALAPLAVLARGVNR